MVGMWQKLYFKWGTLHHCDHDKALRGDADRADFLLELTCEEHHALLLRFATSKPGRGGRRKLPLAFTEHGAIMVATIFHSPHKLEMSV